VPPSLKLGPNSLRIKKHSPGSSNTARCCAVGTSPDQIELELILLRVKAHMIVIPKFILQVPCYVSSGILSATGTRRAWSREPRLVQAGGGQARRKVPRHKIGWATPQVPPNRCFSYLSAGHFNSCLLRRLTFVLGLNRNKDLFSKAFLRSMGSWCEYVIMSNPNRNVKMLALHPAGNV
jgi:hypothetical protein